MRIVLVVDPKNSEFLFSNHLERKSQKNSLTTDLPEYKVTNLRHIVYEFYKTEGNRVTLTKLNKKNI